MSNALAAEINRLQEQILQIVARSSQSLTDATATAFREVPRHGFVRNYRMGEKVVTVTPENLPQHLPAIYQNGVLTLWENKEEGIYSTISQPTLVLGMLDLLQLAKGQTVFELGAGSGWNAALIGHIVGTTGRVYSVEIIPQIAEAARQVILERGITNVEIITGDGGSGYAEGAPYDRAVFTAGSYDLPRVFHDQVRVGGLLLMVVKVEGGGDQLMLLEKKTDCFESKHGALCAFVPMTGKHSFVDSAPVPLESLSWWGELSGHEVQRRTFWWGADVNSAFWASVGVRSYMSVAEPQFKVFHEPGKLPSDPHHWFWGIFDVRSRSLVIARKGELISYGNLQANDRLMTHLHQWVDYGMPSMASMNLRIFPSETPVSDNPRQWIVRRKESNFVWSLRA